MHQNTFIGRAPDSSRNRGGPTSKGRERKAGEGKGGEGKGGEREEGDEREKRGKRRDVAP